MFSIDLPPVAERIAVQETYVSGLSHIELIGGGCARFVLYINKTNKRGTVFQIPKLNVLMPMSEIPDAIRKALLIPIHETTVVRRLKPMWPH